MVSKILLLTLMMAIAGSTLGSVVNADHRNCEELASPDRIAECKNNHSKEFTLGNAGDLGIPRVLAGESQLNNVLNTVFIITGALATIFIIIGGLRYVLSLGNPDAVKKAKNTILYAIVGLLLSVFVFTIVNFVISNL